MNPNRSLNIGGSRFDTDARGDTHLRVAETTHEPGLVARHLIVQNDHRHLIVQNDHRIVADMFEFGRNDGRFRGW